MIGDDDNPSVPARREPIGPTSPYWSAGVFSYAQGIRTVCDFLIRFSRVMRRERIYLLNRIEASTPHPDDPEHVITFTMKRESAERLVRNLGLAVERAEHFAKLLQTVHMPRRRRRP